MTDQKALEGALLKGAQTIEDAQGQIQSELSSLQSKLAGIGSAWQGEAASAFQKVMSQWDAEARKRCVRRMRSLRRTKTSRPL